MFNTIQFIVNKSYIENSDDKPIPIKTNIPDWFKKLKHDVDYGKTVKGCMPFLDTLTTGYLLKMPMDIAVHHNYYDIEEKKKATVMKSLLFDAPDTLGYLNLNYKQLKKERHPIGQLGECPIVHKNKHLPVNKILNPWIIKTPPGYSCLFVPPLNNSDDRFSIIPGIVDTDGFPNEINFPFVVNGDKYPVLNTIVKKGTPYVQIIPFKRENWRMEIKDESHKKNTINKFFYFKEYLNAYKNNFWKKKSWK